MRSVIFEVLNVDPNNIVLRPRFVLESAKSKDQLVSDFRNFKNEATKKFNIKIVDTHIFIDVLKHQSHFWSPQLHLEIIEEGKQTKVKGLFGPKPQVWTFFMFLHFVVATFFIGCLVWVYVNSTLEKKNVFPIIMLFVLPFLWILLYLIGRLGKESTYFHLETRENKQLS